MAFTGVAIFGEDECFYLPKSNEEIYGTWINKDMSIQKRINYYWGYGESYREASSETPTYRITFTIVEKWIDSEGNVWFKNFTLHTGNLNPVFEILKISNNGTVCESVRNQGDFPSKEELNVNHPYYSIYYRQE
jgi:hypothetical protein